MLSRFPLHGVGLKSTQTLIGYSDKLCVIIALAYFAGRTTLFVAGVCLHFSFSTGVSSCTKDTRTQEWRFYVGTSFTPPCLLSCLGVVFSNGTLSIAENNLLSCQQTGLFGDFHGTPLANNLIGCNPVSILEDLFGDKRCPGGALSSPLSAYLIRLPQYLSEEKETS